MKSITYTHNNPFIVDLLKQIMALALRKENVIVFIIDGLGKSEIPLDWRKKVYTTIFPSSTPPFVYTFFSLLWPGEHGFLEWYANFADAGIERPIQIPPYKSVNGTEVRLDQETVFPFKPFLAELAEADIPCALLSPFAKSLFSRSVTPKNCYTKELQTLSDIFPLPSSGYTVVYWPEIDSILHHEWKTTHYYRALETIGTVLHSLEKNIEDNTHIFIFSDHGLTKCTIPITLPQIATILPYGGSRVAFYNASVNRQNEVVEELESLPGGHQVVSIEDLRGLLGGKISQRAIERYGNIVAIAEGDTYFTYPYKKHQHIMLGHHGGLSEEEMEVYVWSNTF
jgi:hypothetical protein